MDSARNRLSRRQFVQAVGVASLALVAGCGGAPGQAPARVYRVGWLGEVGSSVGTRHSSRVCASLATSKGRIS